MKCKYKLCNNEIVYKKKNVVYCSNSCRAKDLKQNRNLLDKNGKSYNYNYNKIRNCQICGKKLHHQTRTGYCSKHYVSNTDFKTKISKSLIGKTGGYIRGGGRGKKGYYKNIWCDSSWELAWILYNEDNNIKFIRNKDYFYYNFEGKKRKYYPDFILEDGTYVEIKGYKRAEDEYKWKSFPYKLKILFKEDMKDILKLIEDKYGKNFTNLYAAVV